MKSIVFTVPYFGELPDFVIRVDFSSHDYDHTLVSILPTGHISSVFPEIHVHTGFRNDQDCGCDRNTRNRSQTKDIFHIISQVGNNLWKYVITVLFKLIHMSSDISDFESLVRTDTGSLIASMIFPLFLQWPWTTERILSSSSTWPDRTSFITAWELFPKGLEKTASRGRLDTVRQFWYLFFSEIRLLPSTQ